MSPLIGWSSKASPSAVQSLSVPVSKSRLSGLPSAPTGRTPAGSFWLTLNRSDEQQEDCEQEGQTHGTNLWRAGVRNDGNQESIISKKKAATIGRSQSLRLGLSGRQAICRRLSFSLLSSFLPSSWLSPRTSFCSSSFWLVGQHGDLGFLLLGLQFLELLVEVVELGLELCVDLVDLLFLRFAQIKCLPAGRQLSFELVLFFLRSRRADQQRQAQDAQTQQHGTTKHDALPPQR